MNSGVFMTAGPGQSGKPLIIDGSHCPIYGFDGTTNALIMRNSGGNQCGLETESYCPCQIGTRGEEPSWFGCSLNIEENRRRMEEGDLSEVIVFPRWSPPSGEEFLDGVLLKDWIRSYEDNAIKG